MPYVVAVVAVALVATLLVGVASGRVRVRSCCAPGDVDHDRRVQMARPEADGDAPGPPGASVVSPPPAGRPPSRAAGS